MTALATVTECETCRGVSRGGRIRVTDEGSEIALDLLRVDRSQWMVLRRKEIDSGRATHGINRRVRVMGSLIKELVRTRYEMGWDRDEPERSDP